MKAEISISRIWFNPVLAGILYRKQALNNFEEFVTNTFYESSEEVLRAIDNTFDDFDEFESFMYNLHAEEGLLKELAEEAHLTLIEE